MQWKWKTKYIIKSFIRIQRNNTLRRNIVNNQIRMGQ